jgi:hypothetical protein
MHSTAPLLDEVGERVQHPELVAHIFPGVSCESMLEEAATLWSSPRQHLPRLKACVLTVVFQTCQRYPGGDDDYIYYFNFRRMLFPKTLLQDGRVPGEDLGNKLTKLLAEFAEHGPGVRRFVRIQQQHVHERLAPRTGTSHYGPLVTAHSARSGADIPRGSYGASMLDEAYQFARAGKKVKTTWMIGT